MFKSVENDRILIMSCSNISTDNYISLINCIESAKKTKIIIDVIALPKADINIEYLK